MFENLDLSMLPAVNAALNATAAALLGAGFYFIKRGNAQAHMRCMIGAFAVSAVFLVTYIIHYIWRAKVAGGTHTTFNHDGVIKLVYYLMLLTHIVLAITVPVFAIVLVRLGMNRRYDRHRKIARFAYPIWMYVSITGVLIYFALYHWNVPVS